MKTNKKFILLLLAGLLITISILGIYFVFIKSKTGLTEEDRIIDTNTGQVIRHKPSKNDIDIIDGQGNTVTTSINKDEKYYIENIVISPNNKKILYTTVYNYGQDEVIEEEDNPESQNLNIKNIDNPNDDLNIHNTYSGVWLSDDKIAYQDAETNEIIIYSLSLKKEILRKDFKLENQHLLQPISEDKLIALPFCYDVSVIKSYLIDLKTNKSSLFLEGEGLKIKTCLGSDYLAYQQATDNGQILKIIKWNSMQEMFNSKEMTVDSVYWNEKGAIYQLNNQGKLAETFSFKISP